MAKAHSQRIDVDLRTPRSQAVAYEVNARRIAVHYVPPGDFFELAVDSARGPFFRIDRPGIIELCGDAEDVRYVYVRNPAGTGVVQLQTSRNGLIFDFPGLYIPAAAAGELVLATAGLLFFDDFQRADGPVGDSLIEPDPSWVTSRQTAGDARTKDQVWYIENGKLCCDVGASASFHYLLANIDPQLQAVVSVIGDAPPIVANTRTYGVGAIARYSLSDAPEPNTVRMIESHTDLANQMGGDGLYSAWLEANAQDPTFTFSEWCALNNTFADFPAGDPLTEVRHILALGELSGALDVWGEFEVPGQLARVTVTGDNALVDLPAGLFGLRLSHNGEQPVYRFSELAIYRSEQVSCSGVQDGDVLRIGSYESAPASGGVATVDMKGERFPLAETVELLRGGSVVASLDPGGVWGGDVYEVA